MLIAIYPNNSTILELGALTNTSTGALIHDATVTATLTDAAGNEVDGEIWPVTLSHVVESPEGGNYIYTLAHDIAITVGARYRVTITAVSGSYHGEFSKTLKAMRRDDC